MSEITSLKKEEGKLDEVSETRQDEFSDDKLVFCRKRKRSGGEVVEEENDGFKTPTRLENRIPEVRECPPAPKKGKTEYSVMLRRKTMLCRRRLNYLPDNDVSSLITDLQWRTTTMTIKK